MVSSDTKLANVVGGKTARVCDNCIRKRARWYCAADDAFLCQSCDGLVHTANPLTRRHERLRLKIVSLNLSSLDKHAPPPWHHGFTKKPRTPRKHGSRRKTNSDESSMSSNPLRLVPEGGSDEPTTVSCEEQLLYQVPVFDPKQAEVTTPSPVDSNHHHHGLILPSDVELADFAADVESLLGKGLDDESFAWEGLGSSKSLERVKVEEDQMQFEIMEMMGEPFQLSFDYDPPLWEEKDDKLVVKDLDDINIGKYDGENYKIKKTRILNLDFDGIIAAWDDQRSPWTTGDRPELDPDDCWPECMGGCGIPHHQRYGDVGMMTGNLAMLDGGREARVSRYREKRRTRLFSKKIRYEVRKLNAEKRPRMKGRFVKRASSSSGFPLLSK